MKSFLYIIKDPLKILISIFFKWHIITGMKYWIKIKYIYISFCVWKVYKMLTIYLTSRVLHATKMKYQFSLKLKKKLGLIDHNEWKL